jgi:hypothetical protein
MNNKKIIAASRIQSFWREHKALSLLKIFIDFHLEEHSDSVSFDDFTKFMMDKNVVNVAGELIYAIQARLRIDLKINNKTLMSSYLFSKYSNEILGEEKKRDILSSQIYFYSRLLTNSLKDNSHLKLPRLHIITIIGQNMLNFSVQFSLWKTKDKSDMIQNIMQSYYQRQVHIDKIKNGELSGDDNQIVNTLKVLKGEQSELLKSIKILDKSFDIKYFEENYSKIHNTIENDSAKLHQAITNNMKIAYFDYIKEGMDNGDYNPLIALITEVRQRIMDIVPQKIKDEIKEKINVEKAKDKINNQDLKKEDIVRLVIHSVNYIGKLQAPIDDESFNQWRTDISEQLDSDGDEFNQNIPEILIQAEERLDKIYKDISSLVAK